MPNPLISAVEWGWQVLKKQLRWYQFGCFPSKKGDCKGGGREQEREHVALVGMDVHTCTILASLRLSLEMLPLHSLQPARPDLAYSALKGSSSAAITLRDFT